MTIKDLEAALGMTRANIRYYEKEGLLSPSRMENGYRDYTQEDLATLQKIKLLRRLQFSVEEIRAFQSGAKDLSAALHDQEARLQKEAADLLAARDLCKQMEAERVCYRSMDAQKYLAQVEELERQGRRFQTVEADVLPTVAYHPWLRLFARGLDFTLYRSFLLIGLIVGARTVPESHPMVLLILSYFTWGVAALVEPLLLCTWGTTPGKWLLGLKLRDADGQKLSLSQAAHRLFGVFSQGEGYGIPIYSIYRNWKSAQACLEGEVLPWDEGLAYTLRDEKPLRAVAAVAAQVACVALVLWVMICNTVLPRHRGELTVAQFAANYNELAARYHFSTSYLLDETGRWEAPGSHGGVTANVEVDGAMIPDLNYSQPPDFTYTLEEGHIRSVTLTYHSAAWAIQPDFGSQRSVAALALLGAQREMTPFAWGEQADALLKRMGETETGTLTVYGLTLESKLTYSGYEASWWGDYLPLPDQPRSFDLTFTATVS